MTTSTGTPYVLPLPPEGTTLIVRSRCLDGGATEMRRVETGATGTYSVHAPLQFFSAFGADGHLGTWSPGYPSLGWARGIPAGDSYGTAPEELLRVAHAARSTDASEGMRETIRQACRWWAQILAGKVVVSTSTLDPE